MRNRKKGWMCESTSVSILHPPKPHTRLVTYLRTNVLNKPDDQLATLQKIDKEMTINTNVARQMKNNKEEGENNNTNNVL